MEKECRKCTFIKDVTLFSRDSSRKDGYQSLCKQCDSQKHSDWRRKNPDKNIAKVKRWQAANKERVRAIHNKKKALRRASKLLATPSWVDNAKLLVLYDKAAEWGFEVDHIVPLRGETVCGLHTWDNLQLLDKSLNSSKGNKSWPDSWS